MELVEQHVTKKMKSTAGAVLFDGWSCNDTHYVAVLGSYCISMMVRENATTSAKQVPRLALLALSRLALLALSPTGQVAAPDDECISNAEATSFNAEARLQVFEEVFSFYEHQYKTWCLCLISDNTSTNTNVARLSGQPIVGFNSHK